MNGVFDVKDFGAAGNGIANDSAAIQEAIDARAAAEYGIVYFPPGTYKCDEQVNLPDFDDTEEGYSINRPFTLMGAGKAATTVRLGAANLGQPNQPRYLIGHPSVGGTTDRGQNSFQSVLGMTLLGPGHALDGNAAMAYDIPVLAISNVYKGKFDLHVEGCPAGPAILNWSHLENGSQGNEFRITGYKGEWEIVKDGTTSYVVNRQEVVRRRGVRYLLDNSGGVGAVGKANDTLVTDCHIYNPLIGVIDTRGHGGWTVTITGAPTGGTFSLTFGGQETTALAYNAADDDIEAALEALSNVEPGDLSVTGGPGPNTPWTVAVSGRFATKRPPVVSLAAADNNLTGGTAPSVTVAMPDIGGGTDNLRVFDNFFAARQTTEVEDGTGGEAETGDLAQVDSTSVMRLKAMSGFSTDDAINGWYLWVKNGSTWEAGTITNYVGSTKEVTISPALSFTPTTATDYRLMRPSGFSFSPATSDTVMTLRTRLGDGGDETYDENADWTDCVLRWLNPVSDTWESAWIDDFDPMTREVTLETPGFSGAPLPGAEYFVQYSDAQARAEGWSPEVRTHAMLWSSRDYQLREDMNRYEGIVPIVASAGLDSEWGIVANYDVQSAMPYEIVNKQEHGRRTDGTDWRPRTWYSIRPTGSTQAPVHAQVGSLAFGNPEDEDVPAGSVRFFINDTGDNLVNGSVVVIRSSDSREVGDAAGSGSNAKHVVVWGPDNKVFFPGELVTCMLNGIAPVLVDTTTTAVAAGDRLLSATGNIAQVALAFPSSLPTYPNDTDLDTPGEVRVAINTIISTLNQTTTRAAMISRRVGIALEAKPSGGGIVSVLCAIGF